jgi:hypothetical protein
LLRAPVLVIPCAYPDAYVARYGEADKVATGLGADLDAWPVPYWHIDAGIAAMAVLLAAVDAGLGALFFGIFHGEDDVRAKFAIPAGYAPIGTIAIGHPAAAFAAGERPGRSVGRGRRPIDEVIHRGRW